MYRVHIFMYGLRYKFPAERLGSSEGTIKSPPTPMTIKFIKISALADFNETCWRVKQINRPTYPYKLDENR